MARRLKPKKEKIAPPEREVGGRSIWSGMISFGLVNIPVKLFMAVRNKDVHFNLMHAKDNARVQRRYICPVENKEIPKEELQKAYEIAPDQYVPVDERELEVIKPKSSRVIDLLYFVDRAEIDPNYFDTPYYLMPAENAAKAYALLLEAMRRTGKSAISKFVLRNKEYIALVRPLEGTLSLETMRFPDEVVAADSLGWRAPDIKLNNRELEMAQGLIESLTSKFEPEKLHDDYRIAVMDLVRKKAEGQQIVTQPIMTEEGPEVIDLMAALQKSLQQNKSGQRLRKSA